VYFLVLKQLLDIVGNQVVVIKSGSIGLISVQVANILGAKKVYLIRWCASRSKGSVKIEELIALSISVKKTL
jgi:threonine dehydrogenase-like Zn-dependent dehydrogenase